ncbi:MAG: peptidoglycan editing factor PgeF [Solirubrobacterales bacterium]
MEYLNLEGYYFFAEDLEAGKVIFSTAENDFNVYKKTETGKSNIEKLKKIFGLEDIGFLNQCHSDIVQVYNSRTMEGDAIITDRVNVGVGVFTADCVPVLIFDIDKKVVAAIHSGWRGTHSKIVLKTIEKMITEFGSNKENLKIYIGPHIKDCCYEVGTEVIEKFKNDGLYKDENIFNKNKLSMVKCIVQQLKSINIDENKIKSIECCTHCSENPKLYSYRRGETDKRLFSFIYIK